MASFRKLWWTARTALASPLWGAIGFPSYVAPATYIVGRRRIYLGSRVRILPGLFIEALGSARIRIGDDVAVGEGVHITALGDLLIGSGSTITGQVTITDIDHEYQDVRLPVHQQPLLHSVTRIGARCFIGMGARIQAGTQLGEGCVVGANAVVRGTYPARCVIVGAPGRVVKYYDVEAQGWVRGDPRRPEKSTERSKRMDDNAG